LPNIDYAGATGALIQVSGDPHMTIAQLVDEVAGTYGRRKCLTYGHMAYTYTAVNRKINQVAHGLRQLGISQGSRIGLFLSNCPEYIFAYFPGTSLMHRLNPLSKLFFLILLTVLTLFSTSILFLATIFVCILLLALLSQISMKI
jgi:hypothetical protein